MTRNSAMSARLLRPELRKHLRRLQRAEIYGPDPALLASLASACSALTTLAIHHSGFGGGNWLASPCFPTVTLLEIFLPLDAVWMTKLSDVLPHLPSYFPRIVELRLHLSAFMPFPPSARNDQQYRELDTQLSDFISDPKVKVNIIVRCKPQTLIGTISPALLRGYFDGMLPRTRSGSRLAIFHTQTAPTCSEWDREDHSYGELPLDWVARAARVAVYGEELDGAGMLSI
ncbi:hypothetical protein FB45DRAFT_1001536 [Roridomyces roridus]|uniref:Uncharacterized protein n=1 Tax=Roridomyces roridus TaxID=1738132 RepID=A0AAD7C1E1_9AGAR|nr:hypothetical protein FB45DRAFT_1001536 [Roridomyces roridus]